MDYVLLLNLDTQTHIEIEIEHPVTRSGAAVQQTDEACQPCRRLRTTPTKTLDDLVFLQRCLGIAAFLFVCHILTPVIRP